MEYFLIYFGIAFVVAVIVGVVWSVTYDEDPEINSDLIGFSTLCGLFWPAALFCGAYVLAIKVITFFVRKAMKRYRLGPARG